MLQNLSTLCARKILWAFLLSQQTFLFGVSEKVYPELPSLVSIVLRRYGNSGGGFRRVTTEIEVNKPAGSGNFLRENITLLAASGAPENFLVLPVKNFYLPSLQSASEIFPTDFVLLSSAGEIARITGFGSVQSHRKIVGFSRLPSGEVPLPSEAIFKFVEKTDEKVATRLEDGAVVATPLQVIPEGQPGKVLAASSPDMFRDGMPIVVAEQGSKGADLTVTFRQLPIACLKDEVMKVGKPGILIEGDGKKLLLRRDGKISTFVPERGMPALPLRIAGAGDGIIWQRSRGFRTWQVPYLQVEDGGERLWFASCYFSAHFVALLFTGSEKSVARCFSRFGILELAFGKKMRPIEAEAFGWGFYIYTGKKIIEFDLSPAPGFPSEKVILEKVEPGIFDRDGGKLFWKTVSGRKIEIAEAREDPGDKSLEKAGRWAVVNPLEIGAGDVVRIVSAESGVRVFRHVIYLGPGEFAVWAPWNVDQGERVLSVDIRGERLEMELLAGCGEKMLLRGRLEFSSGAMVPLVVVRGEEVAKTGGWKIQGSSARPFRVLILKRKFGRKAQSPAASSANNRS